MAGVVPTQLSSRTARTVLEIIAVAACYYAGGRLGLLKSLVVEESVVSPIWPPTGIALAALLVLGLRCWPGIAIGAFLVIISISPLQLNILGFMIGNTLAPICSYLLLRAAGFRKEMDRLRDGMALVFLGALVGMLISALAGVGVLYITGKIEAEDFWAVWSAWWAGDAMGVLVVTPVLLLLTHARWPRSTARWGEVLALVVCTVVVAPFATRSSLGLLFLAYPLLIWAALRFQLVGSTLSALFISVLAAVAAVDAVGPFAHRGRLEIMINLQAFNVTLALSGLLLAAVVTEQYETRQRIEEACRELAEVVDQLAPGEATHRWPLPERDARRGRRELGGGPGGGRGGWPGDGPGGGPGDAGEPR
ncbi:MASE1 domain-containing protein [Streptomyces sp. NPDC091292]|uniref:MASE1 domain-containing protein n=1 Tax=Streptomyces sp. NPDC091292 TaxID=3365991 RepID=UPI0038033226